MVTGASTGLGKAMATGLAGAGCDVVVVSRHREDLELALAEIVEGTDVRGFAVEADLLERAAVAGAAREAVGRAGRVDILVNNVGLNIPQAIEETTDDAWDRVVELNLSSTMALTRALVPGMRSRGWGRIVYISSIMAFASKEGRSAYSATKTGLIGLTRANAIDLGPFGITVNGIAPGLFVTRATRGLLSDQEHQSHIDRTALGRSGEPDELVGPLLALVSEAGSYVTGTTLVVDGGWLVR
jgi:NAD(P)-dependent dehydrogenase (short-subunit alcohol dehydrogenase family)